MTARPLMPLQGVVRDYPWGRPGGIGAALGRREGSEPEAELWLGAHAAGPARVTRPAGDWGGAPSEEPPWGDLAQWEAQTRQHLPYLFKLLAIGGPLSLQAHPDAERAGRGFAREEAHGVPWGARERTYKDPQAKPEIIVAVEDGLDALCGFRPVSEVADLLDAVEACTDEPALDRWRALLTCAHEAETGVAAAVEWLLSGEEQVADLVAALVTRDLGGARERDADLLRLLSRHHPGDPGIAVALMLNRVSLAAGEALWLPPGNIHAYLSGLGVEVMNPSDNVLRGGLTGKHVDVPELLRVLDFTPGPAPRLAPVDVAPGVTAYRPSAVANGAAVPWQLLRVSGPAEVATGSPSIALVLAGEFTLRADDASLALSRGEACFVDRAGPVRIEGAGDLYLATTTA